MTGVYQLTELIKPVRLHDPVKHLDSLQTVSGIYKKWASGLWVCHKLRRASLLHFRQSSFYFPYRICPDSGRQRSSLGGAYCQRLTQAPSLPRRYYSTFAHFHFYPYPEGRRCGASFVTNRLFRLTSFTHLSYCRVAGPTRHLIRLATSGLLLRTDSPSNI